MSRLRNLSYAKHQRYLSSNENNSSILHHNTSLPYTHRMAPPSFTTLPDEILLEIVEWTTEIVTAAINNAGTLIRDDLAFRRKRRAGAKIISTAEYMLLKHTVLSLSSVDQRFRLMLASRFFSSLELNPVYKKDTMQRLGAALAFSPMLRACLK